MSYHKNTVVRKNRMKAAHDAILVSPSNVCNLLMLMRRRQGARNNVLSNKDVSQKGLKKSGLIWKKIK